MTDAYVCRLLPLTCLAPDIVEAIVLGRQPRTLTARGLGRLVSLPLNWTEQRRLLGFEARVHKTAGEAQTKPDYLDVVVE